MRVMFAVATLLSIGGVLLVVGVIGVGNAWADGYTIYTEGLCNSIGGLTPKRKPY